MKPAEILGIAVALGVDCLALSAGIGASAPRRTVMVLIGLLFGLFQFGMALGGMVGGAALESLLSSPVRLAPPLLIAAIGVLMITKGLKGAEPSLKLAGVIAAVAVAVGTSLDALGVGVALGLVNIVSVWSAVTIGLVAAGMSAVGFAGGRVLARYTGVAEDIGGGFLILLAILMFLSLR